MESTTSEVIIIALTQEGWCLLDARNWKRLQGPYDKHKQAKEAAETRMYRVKQGWAP
jgi:hypothetical protein